MITGVKESLRRIPDKGMGYGVLRYMTAEAVSGEWDLEFNYLGQTDNNSGGSDGVRSAGESRALEAAEGHRSEKVVVNSIIRNGRLVVSWNYSGLHYESSTMEGLARQYIKYLEATIAHCVGRVKEGKRHHTPSDYGLGAEVTDATSGERSADVILIRRLVEGHTHLRPTFEINSQRNVVPEQDAQQP